MSRIGRIVHTFRCDLTLAIRHFVLAAALLIMTGMPAAQAQNPEAAARSVALFDELCYEMLPDLDTLDARAADNNWTPITGAELEAFSPDAKPELLKAWHFEDSGQNYRIAITRGPMDEQGKLDFPEFADANVFACSILLPNSATREEVAAEMVQLMEREPDETDDSGAAQIDSWSGESDEVMAIINHVAAKGSTAAGLISVTLFLKP